MALLYYMMFWLALVAFRLAFAIVLFVLGFVFGLIRAAFAKRAPDPSQDEVVKE